MKRNKILWLGAILFSTALCCGCSSDDDDSTTPVTRSGNTADQSLYAIARQGDDAPIQYKAEIPMFSLSDIESFNTATGEITFKGNVVFDSHIFYDISCKYRVYFYSGDDLLFDARAVSWLSSAGYFDQLTFQCGFFEAADYTKTSKTNFYIHYGYPGTIDGDESIKELKKKNAAGMERFLSILSKAGKIVNAE